jgi:hypothetical protein
MKYINRMGLKSLCILLLSIVMISTTQAAVPSKEENGLFLMFREVESLVKSVFEPQGPTNSKNFEETVKKDAAHSKNRTEFENFLR